MILLKNIFVKNENFGLLTIKRLGTSFWSIKNLQWNNHFIFLIHKKGLRLEVEKNGVSYSKTWEGNIIKSAITRFWTRHDAADILDLLDIREAIIENSFIGPYFWKF